MDAQELEARIAALPYWHHCFEFDNGVRTKPFKPERLNRQEQRRRYFFDALLRVTGGSLRGHRVLDLGCNAGYWSLTASEAGADFVLGVDGRAKHIEQARLVFEAKGVDPARYRFEQGNIFEHEFGERFDVVLCLGLMYHVSKPVELFELIVRAGAETVVVDTNLFPAPFSFFQVRNESVSAGHHAVDYEVVFVPTRKAVLDLASQFGYKAAPLALNMTDWTGMGDYREQLRLAFICSKHASLDALARERRPALTPAVAPWLVRAGRSRWRRLRS
jgi:tRNA (mo5U34)-methyltransferase